MSELSQSLKRALVAVVVLLVFSISVASLLVLVVDAVGVSSIPAPTLANAANVQAIYVADKARLDYLFLPIDKMSTLLQIIAASVIGYIFAKETVPAVSLLVTRALTSRLRDGEDQA